MIWLLALVLILQAAFYWILQPLTLLATPILELRGLALFVLLIGLWLFSGRGEQQAD